MGTLPPNFLRLGPAFLIIPAYTSCAFNYFLHTNANTHSEDRPSIPNQFNECPHLRGLSFIMTERDEKYKSLA